MLREGRTLRARCEDLLGCAQEGLNLPYRIVDLHVEDLFAELGARSPGVARDSVAWRALRVCRLALGARLANARTVAAGAPSTAAARATRCRITHGGRDELRTRPLVAAQVEHLGRVGNTGMRA